jgi:centrosomal protein CEP135
MDAQAERKYLMLKKRLDALHYCYPLSPESTTLVEKLLNDLIKTTEGFQGLKKTNEELISKQIKEEQTQNYLKKENSKLTKENNDLHFEMMKIKEDLDYRETKWKTTFRSVEGEKNDLKFLLQQKDNSLRKIEEEVN